MTTNVSVGNDFFSPQNVAINPGDTVKWTWAETGIPHNTTGPGTPPLWASTNISSAGTTYSHTFATAGSYAYECTIHAAFGMTGSVTVRSANAPPSVAITAPTNGAVFSAPWTGTIQATASDSDGTVSQVQFFAGAAPLGTVANPGANVSLEVNLPAGTYTLTAVATDNLGATTTSAPVVIHVLTPDPIVLSSIQRANASSAQFTFSTTAGLSYVVERSTDLVNFSAIATNTASGTTITFTDNAAQADMNFYRVSLLPNP